jgi:hypothetical protein
MTAAITPLRLSPTRIALVGLQFEAGILAALALRDRVADKNGTAVISPGTKEHV